VSTSSLLFARYILLLVPALSVGFAITAMRGVGVAVEGVAR
jgi:uncharacterized transporter YbjL